MAASYIRKGMLGCDVVVVTLLLFALCFVSSSAFGQAPTSLTISPSQGFAGVDCYTVTVGNGSNMVVQFDYDSPTGPDSFISRMRSDGTQKYCLGQDIADGLYTYSRISNVEDADALPLDLIPPVAFRVRPPKPTSLSISPSS